MDRADKNALGAPPEPVKVDLLSEVDRGRFARTPWAIPFKGWRDILLRVMAGMFRDRVFSLAAGVAFYAILAIFPALGVTLSVYGFFADATTVSNHLVLMAGLLPPGTAELLTEQMNRLTMSSSSSLTWALASTSAVSLWSANAGIAALFDALNVVFKEIDKRSLLRFYATTLFFTLLAVLFLVIAINGVVVLPIVLFYFGYGGWTETLLSVFRWPAMFLVVVGLLSVFYRYGPSRRRAKWRWVSVGSVTAALLWIGASMIFSWYVQSFDSYNRMYGSLGAVIGFMMWLWLSSVVVLLGAEIDAETEMQTVVDSTEGPPRPIGLRGAVVADTVGEAQ